MAMIIIMVAINIIINIKFIQFTITIIKLINMFIMEFITILKFLIFNQKVKLVNKTKLKVIKKFNAKSLHHQE